MTIIQENNITAGLKKRVYITEIKETFHLNQVCGDSHSLNRWVIALDINRPGLELAGFKGEMQLKRIVVLGIKEQEYLKTIDYETQKDRFDFLTDIYTPCIIVTAGLPVPDALKEIADQKNFPVFASDEQTYIFTSELTSFLSEKLAPTDSVHGEMLNIFGIGVLIIGDSGIGKSELALDLVRRGHMLVSDDVVDYAKVHNKIVCSAPDMIAKMIEVRGLGILDVTMMFGAQSYREKKNLDLVIKLVSKEEYNEHNIDRLSPSEKTMSFFDIEKTMLEISMLEGKSMAPIVEAAVINYILKIRGIDSNENFKESVKESILKKSEELK